MQMFFEERILSILPGDKVLEIGPGATPYHRSDIFLEKLFETEEELIAQSGHVGLLSTDKKIVYYKGDIFPFKDDEFDYVICSHVLEHVENVDVFVKEVLRVGRKGYFEFPTIYYDYIYNFPEHLQFVFFRDDCIYWMPKTESGLANFSAIQQLFYESCHQKYYRLIDDFRHYFFQGFEWQRAIKTKKVTDLSLLIYKNSEFDFTNLGYQKNIFNGNRKSKFKNFLIKIINKI